jgi:hypothetical protein
MLLPGRRPGRPPPRVGRHHPGPRRDVAAAGVVGRRGLAGRGADALDAPAPSCSASTTSPGTPCWPSPAAWPPTPTTAPAATAGRPTSRLVELLRCSLSTVQRARRVLKALGFVVELVRGRSIMTRAERLAGLAPRLLAPQGRGRVRAVLPAAPGAEEEALRDWREVLALEAPTCASVDGDTPPGALEVSTSSSLVVVSSAPNRERGGRSAPRSYRGRAGRRARRLAEATVRDRLGWLHGQSWRRLAPTLAKFARAGWTVARRRAGVAGRAGARGHRVPRELRHPAAYLAGLLRDVDPAGVRPTVELAAHEAWLREQAAAERAARRARVLAIAGRCAHGVPAAAPGSRAAASTVPGVNCWPRPGPAARASGRPPRHAAGRGVRPPHAGAPGRASRAGASCGRCPMTRSPTDAGHRLEIAELVAELERRELPTAATVSTTGASGPTGTPRGRPRRTG